MGTDGQFRTCCKCKVKLPLVEFSKDKGSPKGYGYRCKECERVHQREKHHYVKNTEAYKTKHRRAVLNNIKLYPDRRKARSLASAKKASIKKSECEKCGETSGLHMHHEDYSKPLDVITLCVACHTKVHHGGIYA